MAEERSLWGRAGLWGTFSSPPLALGIFLASSLGNKSAKPLTLAEYAVGWVLIACGVLSATYGVILFVAGRHRLQRMAPEISQGSPADNQDVTAGSSDVEPLPPPRRQLLALAAAVLVVVGLTSYLIAQGKHPVSIVAGGTTVTSSATTTTSPAMSTTTTSALSTTTTAVQLARWSQPVPVNPGGDLTAISCATPTFCAAASSNGEFYSYNGGGWATTASTDDTLSAVDCTSATFCAAVGWTDGGGDAFTFNGTSWSTPDTIDPDHYLHSISCATPTFCVAGAAVNAFTFNGTSWSALAGIDETNTGSKKTPLFAGATRGFYGLHQISCPSSTFCAAIDGWGNIFTFNGTSWSGNRVDAVKELGGVSCPSSSFCAAIADGQVMTYDGGSWSAPETVDGGASLTGISCTSSDFCVAVDSHGNALAFNGTLWSSPEAIDDTALTGVSCLSVDRCMAVDSHGSAIRWS